MFGTATTFSYHNPSSQNAKGLFSNIAIPSATQLLVSLPLSGYFTKEQNKTPQPTAPPQNISPSAPQQPPVHNKRKQQRKSLLQNSFSSAIASTFAGGNMGNILTLSRNNDNSNDTNTTNSTTSPPPNTDANPANNNNNNDNVVNDSTNKRSSVSESSPPSSYRRKRLSNKINRKKIDQSIAFSAFSVEEDHQGNPECASDLYFLALDQFLESFPSK